MGFFFVVLLWAGVCVVPSHGEPSWVPGAEKGLEEVLGSPQGLYRTNTSDPSFLSETLTLRMELAVLRKDKAVFDMLCGYLEEYFFSPLGLLYWQLEPSGEPREFSNASIDDLRALRALSGALVLWPEPRYRELYDAVQEGLYLYNVRENRLLDGCHWKKSGLLKVYRVEPMTEEFSLSYGDLEALRELAARYPRWRSIYVGTLGILSAGAAREGAVPWTYRFEDSLFTYEKNNPINSMIYLLTMVRVGLMPRELLLPFLEEFRRTGKIVDSRGAENIAVYALASMAFYEAGYVEDARKVFGRLEVFVLALEGYGGLLGYVHQGEEPPAQAWAFDNLLALQAAEVLGEGP